MPKLGSKQHEHDFNTTMGTYHDPRTCDACIQEHKELDEREAKIIGSAEYVYADDVHSSFDPPTERGTMPTQIQGHSLDWKLHVAAAVKTLALALEERQDVKTRRALVEIANTQLKVAEMLRDH